ncbi:UDP-N-acetylmuramate--L-alanine ligase [Desulfohalobium retbaense]|uniref:UDP-N-acetylmuramate--L-alanine ligase n=1 Tax=Desulfohalobium retbaense (strain ATCC 49708 / DSM 5692 / JCM 16813 / HR100) TaxID=485915 RepID=C8X0U2_DESRD|nr:UDP-N-acetylmuramate--L-alanine ligase [Desulfohalobium retbaense]ACV68039.1 UDP-N-acetylmuramate/alanine ligase [Desulfohalobium retbaense DSM 5692]
MQFKIQHIHMIGIGGAGMSGIAEVLLSLGYTVTGSDLSENAAVRRLRELGATIYPGHARGYLGDAEVVVRSSAVADDNPELIQAREDSVPVIPRAEMLAELMRLKTGIAVGGTHGKTTTTSFLGTIFKEAGLDPTVIIGGRLNSYGSNAFLGQGEFLIAEADESDGTFLCLLPIMTVVTNVDADHMDFYADQTAIDDSFVHFMNQIPFYGLNVVCGDDPGVQRLLPRIKRPVVTYGLEEDNDVRAEILGFNGGSHFRLIYQERPIGELHLKHPGRHNVLNALAAAALALEAGVSEDAVIHGLDCFGGVGRRFETKGERDGVLVVDDYGHHPTEIAATLTTARETYPERRLVVLFQPHRFTRTQALFGQFCRAFEEADLLLLTEIYPASETPIPGVTGANLAQGIRQVSQTRVEFFNDFEAAQEALPGMLRPGDLLITLGAGSVWKVGEHFLQHP